MGLAVIFDYQSQHCSFDDWVSLLTLCLAPLIAHLISGVPSQTYLHTSRPCWHDRIVLYNPTTIMWRYFAVTDLRLRCISWDAFEMAANSALFWTADGWDGSYWVLQKSREYYTYLGSSETCVNMLSFSAVKTAVVTLQGAQALFAVLRAVLGTYPLRNTLALNNMLFPLTVLGLLRLPAALWLPDERVYRDEDGEIVSPMEGRPDSLNEGALRLVLSGHRSGDTAPKLYHLPFSRRGLIVRIFWLAVITGLLVLCFLVSTPILLPPGTTDLQTSTTFMIGLFYQFLFIVTLPVLAIYALRKRSSSVLPCLGRWWYKVYTIVLFAFMLATFIIAALETRKTPCGSFTSLPPGFDDHHGLCPYSSYVSISGDRDDPFGQIQLQLADWGVWNESLDGWCQFDRGIIPELG